MKKQTIVVRRYWLDDNWYIDEEVTRNSWEYWIGYRDYGCRIFMFGTPDPFNVYDIDAIMWSNEFAATYMEEFEPLQWTRKRGVKQ